EAASIAPGGIFAEVPARHCELVDAEPAGTGTGLPGLVVKVGRPPMIAPVAGSKDLVVGVETTAEEQETLSGPFVSHGGKSFRIWREVENFSTTGDDRFVYMVDRMTGAVIFAPALRRRTSEGMLESEAAALAEFPGANREIRVWYQCGGGAGGNVMANTLTTLKDPIPGMTVTNPLPATGGRQAESLENAMRRGPQELHTLQRAVTARDFEHIARRSSGAVDRAHAFTKAMLWTYARPGTVEVLLVPHIPGQIRDRVSMGDLRAHETPEALDQIQRALDERKPLGTACIVKWAHCKPVKVRARLSVYREEDPAAVRERVLDRLFRTITPLSTTPEGNGWPFGRPLTRWDIYRIIDEEPGVNSVSDIRLVVDEVPDRDVKAVCADAYQRDTWYAGAGEQLFRSTNTGDGWESVGRFPNERVVAVKSFPRETGLQDRSGLLAVATQITGATEESAVHVSHDCGESWKVGLRMTFRVDDLAWVERETVPVLLLATERGLYELAVHEAAEPFQVLVAPDQPALGFYAVAVSTDVWGGTSVAVAARGDKGVYLSDGGGRTGTYRLLGLEGKMVRHVAFQHYSAHRYLWACTAAIGNDPGQAAFRWLMTGAEENPEGWRQFAGNWNAGGCRGIAFHGPVVLAASHRGGVLRLDVTAPEPAWEPPTIKCNLPLRGPERLFQPVDALAVDPSSGGMFAAGLEGIYRSRDHGKSYEHVSSNTFLERVTLPGTWLFCSAEHDLEVDSEDETT
uniref:putative baseplate assembly protein n=1 Tax=Desulfococcus sp. TaxID=2025834 RepID=UPI00359487AA